MNERLQRGGPQSVCILRANETQIVHIFCPVTALYEHVLIFNLVQRLGGGGGGGL
jgi:hypothetical protein